MSEVFIMPGWPTLDPMDRSSSLHDRYEPDTDDLYEEQLKRCRRDGHGRMFRFVVDGLEVLICGRCTTKFVEAVE